MEMNKGLAIANPCHVMANCRNVTCTGLPELPAEDFVLIWNEHNDNSLMRVFLEELTRGELSD